MINKNLRVDLFSVARRNFPSWNQQKELEVEAEKNSLINHSLAQIDTVLERRADRLAELIDMETRFGLVYFCERYWLESLVGGRCPYNNWVFNLLRPFCATPELCETAQVRRQGLNLGAFRLPPLLSEKAKSWIEYSNSSPCCNISSKMATKVNCDWFVMALHILHNLNYYLEMVVEQVSDADRSEVCQFDWIELETHVNYSQAWTLGVDPGGGPHTGFFWRDEARFWQKGLKPLDTETGPCWYPGNSSRIPEPVEGQWPSKFGQ